MTRCPSWLLQTCMPVGTTGWWSSRLLAPLNLEDQWKLQNPTPIASVLQTQRMGSLGKSWSSQVFWVEACTQNDCQTFMKFELFSAEIRLQNNVRWLKSWKPSLHLISRFPATAPNSGPGSVGSRHTVLMRRGLFAHHRWQRLNGER